MESIARNAMDAGSDYELGSRVTNIEHSKRGISVSTSGDAGQRRFEAQIAIIASGFGSPLLRMVGLKDRGNRDFMVGAQAEVDVNGLEDTEVYLGERIAPGSFGWLVPLSGSRALIGIMASRGLNGQMGRFISDLHSDGRVREVIKEPRQWGIPLKPLPRTYCDRILVVGDAAGLAKPTTGGGIYYGLLSGELAANAAHEAFIAGDFTATQLRRYQKRWRGVFGRELRVGYYTRSLYEAMDDDQVERLVSLSCGVQDELVNSQDFSFDWHSKVLLKAVRHGELLPLIRSFGPLVSSTLARLVRAMIS